MPKQPPRADYYSKPGAALIAERIASYWRRRGYFGIVATRYQLPDSPTLYGVRSNIGGDGYPPRCVI